MRETASNPLPTIVQRFGRRVEEISTQKSVKKATHANGDSTHLPEAKLQHMLGTGPVFGLDGRSALLAHWNYTSGKTRRASTACPGTALTEDGLRCKRPLISNQGSLFHLLQLLHNDAALRFLFLNFGNLLRTKLVFDRQYLSCLQ